MANTKQQTRSRAKKPYGPNIVRAWFDTIFHDALNGLDTEKDFLVHRNTPAYPQPAGSEASGL